jgi:hypothetical protein
MSLFFLTATSPKVEITFFNHTLFAKKIKNKSATATILNLISV